VKTLCEEPKNYSRLVKSLAEGKESPVTSAFNVLGNVKRPTHPALPTPGKLALAPVDTA
jgi:hypothetical protein